jgi:hypothetical protein
MLAQPIWPDATVDVADCSGGRHLKMVQINPARKTPPDLPGMNGRCGRRIRSRLENQGSFVDVKTPQTVVQGCQ